MRKDYLIIAGVFGGAIAVLAIFLWIFRPRPYGESGMWLMYAVNDYQAQVICMRFREGILPFSLEQYAAHPRFCEDEAFNNRYGLLDGCQWEDRTQICQNPEFANWGQLGEEPEIGDRVPLFISPDPD